jgi:hypothetical protein
MNAYLKRVQDEIRRTNCPAESHAYQGIKEKLLVILHNIVERLNFDYRCNRFAQQCGYNRNHRKRSNNFKVSQPKDGHSQNCTGRNDERFGVLFLITDGLTFVMVQC